jgi:hypothetical protein
MMLWIAAAAALLVIGAFFVTRSLLRRRGKKAQTSKMFKGLPRLPKFAVPRRYDLELRPDLNACKFDGKLAVTLDVLQDTKYLVLNAADLVIANSSVCLRSTASSKVNNNISFKALSIYYVAIGIVLQLVNGVAVQQWWQVSHPPKFNSPKDQ